MADQTITVRIGAAVDDFMRAMGQVEDKLRDTVKTVANSGEKMQAAGESMTKAGQAMSLGLTTPLVGAGGFAVKAAMDWESAFAGVRKTVDATESQFAELEKGILDMTRVMPASAVEIAGVAEAAGQLGIERESILGFTETMINLGEATNLTADEAATALAQFANVVQMPQENFERLGSTIVALGNTMATTEADIVNMSQRLAAQGKQVGMSEAEIMALAASMSSLGIEAEAGGTAMTTVLKRMQTAVSDGGKELQLWADLAGTTADEFKTAFEDDAVGALDAVIKGLAAGAAEGENMSSMLADLGITGIREADTMMRLAGAGDVLSDALKTANAGWDENVALTNEAAQRYRTFESQLAMFYNELKILGMELGNVMIPILRDLMDRLTPLIRRFAGMSEASQKWVLALGAIAAAIGPVLIFLGSVTKAVGTLLVAFKKVAPVISKAFAAFKGLSKLLPFIGKGAVTLTGGLSRVPGLIGLIATAITAAITVGQLLVKNWDDISGGAAKAWQSVKDGFSNMSDSLSDGMDNMREYFSQDWETIRGDFKDFATRTVKAAGEGLRNLPATISEKMGEAEVAMRAKSEEWDQAIADGVANLGDTLSRGWDKVKGVAADKWGELTTTISDAMDSVTRSGEQKGEELRQVFTSKVAQTATEAAEKWDGFKTATAEKLGETVTTIQTTMEAWGTAFASFFASLPNRIITGLEGVKAALQNFIETQSAENAAAFENWGNQLQTWFGSIPGRITEWLAGWAASLALWFASIPERMGEWLGGWAETMATWFTSIPERFGEWLSGWVSALATWWTNVRSNISEWLAGWAATIGAWFNDFPSNFAGWLAGWAAAIKSWFDDMVSTIKQKLETWWQAIKDWFAGVPNKPEVKNAGKNIVDKLASGTEEQKSDFVRRLGKLIVDIIGLAMIAVAVAAFAAGRELIERFIAGIQNMFGNIRTAATNAFNAFKEKISGMSLFQVGRDIITGLVAGMGDMLGSVVSKAKEIASAAYTAAKNFLESKSPSRLFRDEVGQMIGAGLIIGMDDMIKPTEKAAQRLAAASMFEAEASFGMLNPSRMAAVAGGTALRGVSTLDRSDASTGAGGGVYRFEIPVLMDGRETARATAEYTEEEIERFKTTRMRAGGVVIRK